MNWYINKNSNFLWAGISSNYLILLPIPLNPVELGTSFQPLGLPKRTSFDQDYFGYYNMKSNGAVSTPMTELNNENEIIVVSGADRRTNPNAQNLQSFKKSPIQQEGQQYSN